MEISVLAPEWGRSNFELARSYLNCCPNQIAGVILIPGPYGIKGQGIEWHLDIDTTRPSTLADYLHQADEAIRQNYAAQLCCIVFVPPERPFELTFLCSQINYPELLAVLDIMTTRAMPLYLSPLDLVELGPMMGITQAIQPSDLRTVVRLNHDTTTLAKIFWYVLGSQCPELLIQHLQKIQAA